MAQALIVVIAAVSFRKRVIRRVRFRVRTFGTSGAVDSGNEWTELSDEGIQPSRDGRLPSRRSSYSPAGLPRHASRVRPSLDYEPRFQSSIGANRNGISTGRPGDPCQALLWIA